MTITQEQLERLKHLAVCNEGNGLGYDLLAALETLEKLPVTADGVIVVPGMELWENVPFGGPGKCPPCKMVVCRVDINAWGSGGGRYESAADECYSTREAAEAARKENR